MHRSRHWHRLQPPTTPIRTAITCDIRTIKRVLTNPKSRDKHEQCTRLVIHSPPMDPTVTPAATIVPATTKPPLKMPAVSHETPTAVAATAWLLELMALFPSFFFLCRSFSRSYSGSYDTGSVKGTASCMRPCIACAGVQYTISTCRQPKKDGRGATQACRSKCYNESTGRWR